MGYRLFSRLGSRRLSRITNVSGFRFYELFGTIYKRDLKGCILQLELRCVTFGLVSASVDIPKLLDRVRCRGGRALSETFGECFGYSVPRFHGGRFCTYPRKGGPMRIRLDLRGMPGVHVTCLGLRGAGSVGRDFSIL